MSNEQDKSKIESLKNKAKMLGITFHPTIGVDKLREKINEKMAGQPDVDPVNSGITEESKYKKRVEKVKEASKLVRVRIGSMDPNKKDWPGEIFSVGNSTVGFFKKYIPYGEEWHVPQIILNTIKSKKMLSYTSTKDSKGRLVKRTRQVLAYTIDYLEPLTPDELAQLAKIQAASGRLEGE